MYVSLTKMQFSKYTIHMSVFARACMHARLCVSTMLLLNMFDLDTLEFVLRRSLDLVKI